MDIKKPVEKSRKVTDFMKYFRNSCLEIIKNNFFASNNEVSEEIYDYILVDNYKIYIDDLKNASKSFIKLNKNKYGIKDGRQYLKNYVILSLIEQIEDERLLTTETLKAIRESRKK